MFFTEKKSIVRDLFLKVFVFSLIFSIFSHSTIAFAEDAPAGGGTPATDPQVQGYLGGAEKSEIDATAQVKTIAVDLLGCSAGQLLSNLIQSGLNTLFGSLTGQLKSQIIRLVPIDTQYTELEKDTKQQTAAHTMQSIFGVPFGSSWDAMAWCIVNSIITDIANKTIEWANNGFSGKPAFLQNPDRFFQGLADNAASTFLQELAYGATGLNICEPFRIQVAIGLSETYGNSYNNINGGGAVGSGVSGAYGRRASCTMSQITQNFQNFGTNNIRVGTTRSGNLNQYRGYWSAYQASTDPRNNAWGSYMMANDYMYARIKSQQNTARFELGLNKGWLNFKKCDDPANPESCDTYTPGSLIQHSLEKSLDIPKDRLVAVQKFDQVITAIVNNLIKIALDKVLESVQE